MFEFEVVIKTASKKDRKKLRGKARSKTEETKSSPEVLQTKFLTCEGGHYGKRPSISFFLSNILFISLFFLSFLSFFKLGVNDTQCLGERCHRK